MDPVGSPSRGSGPAAPRSALPPSGRPAVLPPPQTWSAPIPTAVLLVIGLLLGAGCVHSPKAAPTAAAPATALPWQRLEFNRPQMGVPFRIVIWATHESRAQAAVDAAYQRVTHLNAVFSDYDPDSEISRLCRESVPGQPVSVSPELAYLLHRSQELAAATDGAFDVTIGPLANLWRRARRLRELPGETLLTEARARVGWRQLQIDPRRRTLTFGVPNMRLDFGGIAKGYAADEALRVLREHGFPRSLVAAAGDLVAGDPPPHQPGWRVEVGAIDLTNAPPPRTFWIANQAVATSGDLFQRLEIGGRRYSHILDPRTGLGLSDHSLVTIIARDGTTADSLATAVSVLGPDRGLQLVERTSGAAALILRAPAEILEIRESRRLSRLRRAD